MLDRLQSTAVEDSAPCAPRVCRLDSESATDVIGAISSDSARLILAELHEEPRPVSALADELDVSIPSIEYHIENLLEAGIVREVDTRYSEKGKEMSVYGPDDDPLVFVGDDEGVDLARFVVSGVGAAVVGIAVVSLAVQWLVTEFLPTLGGESVRKAASAGAIDGVTVSPVPPGLVFFSGGTFALAVALAFWYLRMRSDRRRAHGPMGERP